MSERLTEGQLRALAMTYRGQRPVIVSREIMKDQPMDIQMAVAEMPHLVRMGLMTREELEPDVVSYSLTASGRAALHGHE